MKIKKIYILCNITCSASRSKVFHLICFEFQCKHLFGSYTLREYWAERFTKKKKLWYSYSYSWSSKIIFNFDYYWKISKCHVKFVKQKVNFFFSFTQQQVEFNYKSDKKKTLLNMFCFYLCWAWLIKVELKINYALWS